MGKPEESGVTVDKTLATVSRWLAMNRWGRRALQGMLLTVAALSVMGVAGMTLWRATLIGLVIGLHGALEYGVGLFVGAERARVTNDELEQAMRKMVDDMEKDLTNGRKDTRRVPARLRSN
jgi:hypothetical protein